MTCLNVTVCRGFAVLSQDTSWSHRFESDARLPDVGRRLGDGQKVIPLEDQRMLLGGAGSYLGYLAWAGEAWRRGGDIDDLPIWSPDVLRRMAAAYGPELAAIAVGWSEREGICRGWAFSFESDFEPAELRPETGHSLTPHPDPQQAGYAALAAAWTPAALGEATEDFHVLLADNQRAAMQAGRYADPSFNPFRLANGLAPGIGGKLHVGRVDREAVTVRVARDWSDVEAAAAPERTH